MPEVQAQTELDAKEFGKYVRAGGWQLGLLVARNVERGPGGRGRRGTSIAPAILGKTSAQKFARMAGTSADRVLRYLDAWEAAAGAGLVPAANELQPGDTVELNEEALGSWDVYYGPVSGGADGRPSRGSVSRRRAAETLAGMATSDRAAVVAGAVAADQEVAQAVAEDTVANARVTAASRRRQRQAAESVAAGEFADAQGNDGLGVMKVANEIVKLRAATRSLVLAYEEVMAANPDSDELREVLTADIMGVKGDLIVALDTLVGDGVDAALAQILRSEGV